MAHSIGVSKAQYQLILAIVSAIPTDMSPPEGTPALVDSAGFYSGVGITSHTKAILQLFKADILVCHGDDDYFEIKLNDREGFLLSFKSGAREAERGNGIGYIDYSDCPLAFAAGYMHWQNRQKKGTRPYSESDLNVCHGFISADTGNEWFQI